VSLGSVAGVTPSVLIDFLTSAAGVDRSHVHRILIRDAHTFVGVAKEVAEQVLARANGQKLLDQDCAVELARR
jgi:hypothetical protein